MSFNICSKILKLFDCIFDDDKLSIQLIYVEYYLLEGCF